MRPALAAALSLLACACAVGAGAAAQDLASSCSSDGVRPPRAIVERFTSAECATCWQSAPARRVGVDELAIDWIVPAARGTDAPLAAGQSDDAPARLAQLEQPPPEDAATRTVRTRVQALPGTLRVAHGQPVNDYLGASVELRRHATAPAAAWLLLVETIPAGSDGTPVERNLVRAAFEPPWGRAGRASARLFESRPLRIPPGARPERLRVVAWVQDGRGRIRAIAQSLCRPPAQR